MSCKVISQNVIPNNTVVRLNEKQARAVAKDLVMHTYYKDLSELQEGRINSLKDQVVFYDMQLNEKDSIITTQKDLINYQDKIINAKHKLELHGYAALQTINATIKNPYIYGDLMAEYGLYSIGAIYILQINSMPSWGLVLRYKVF